MIRIPLEKFGGRPTVDPERGGLCICFDGIDMGDENYIVFTCPECGAFLFKGKELNFAGKDGYWRGPRYTLVNKHYDQESETISCDCGWCSFLTFFSYLG